MGADTHVLGACVGYTRQVTRTSNVARPSLSVFVVLGLIAAGPGAAEAARPSGVLVAATANAQLPRAHEVARIDGVRFARVPVPRGWTADGYASALRRVPGIAGAQPNVPVPRAAIAGTCVDRPTSPQLEIAMTTNARSRPLPVTRRTVAVLDTGVDPTVPELAGRVLPASDVIGGPAPGPADDDGHGTQVAAAAAGAAGVVAGVSPTSLIMPIRIASASVLATPESVVRGLAIAAARRARVAVLPSSQPLTQVGEASVTAVGVAVNAARTQGVITVVPVGNEGKNQEVFPGGLAHVLTVGSAGRLAVRDPFSNFGRWVDLVAPGADLVLPAPAAICLSGYARASGTSFSAAAVAGAVALIAAARPALATAQLYDIVRRMATRDAGLQGFDENTGFGLLDVGAGLTAAPAGDDPRPREVNDNVHWLRQRPTVFPTYLRRTRRTTTRGTVSPGKDPQDAFKVQLGRNDLLRARVRTADPDAVLYATIWDRTTGPFDMRLPGPRTLLHAAGFTQNPAVSHRAVRAGTYYVAVFAPDRAAPGDPAEAGDQLATSSPPHTAYTLAMDKRCSSTRTLRIPLTRLRRPGRAMTALAVYDNGTRRARRSRGAISRRITLRGMRNGRHRIVFKASFTGQPRISTTIRIRTRCALRLSR